MNLNVLVRGQSNSILMMESNGWAGYGTLQSEVQRLLGFDGKTDTISLVYDRYDQNQSTAFGGTALIGDWLNAKNGDWKQGWNVGFQEQSLLNKVNSLAADQKDDPTATLWMHSEYDSAKADLTAEQWMSAVRFDAAQVRAALGQGAESTPYLFVSAMPYWGTTQGHNAIKEGMERLAADGGFNADIAARMLDTDIDNDNTDNDWATKDYGGPHMDAEDAIQTVQRAARSIAETFAQYAKPGSPVAQAGGNIDDHGPQVVKAALVGTNQLRVDVAHDHATGFQALDADAAHGLGWSVMSASGQVLGTAAQVVDSDTLLLTFSGAVPTDGTLYYGYGYGRLGGEDGSGRGNAVYDNEGLPIWVGASGLKVGASVTPPPTPTPPPPPTQGLTLNGTAGNDLLKGGTGADVISGGNGHDTLNGGGGDDALNGGAGNDALRGGAGSDQLTTGTGADRVLWGVGDGKDAVTDFTLGTDQVGLLGVTADKVTARLATVGGATGLELDLAGGETLFLKGIGMVTAKALGLSGSFASAPAPVPVPAPGAITGTAGDDALKGTAGNDTLLGGAGADDLQGLGGNDLLRGGTGDDGMVGGAGADTFVFARGDGHDWVEDFQVGVDKLRLEGISAGEVTQTVETRWSYTGVALHFGSDEVFVAGPTAKLAAADMIFG